MTIRTIILSIMLPVLALGTGSCFTGVEGTPKIRLDDVRRTGASKLTPEQTYLADFEPEAPSNWRKGKPFLVASDRISLIFTQASSPADNLTGRVLAFEEFTPSRSLTGDDAGEVVFTGRDNTRYYYRVPGLTASKLDTLSRLQIPFTVDLDLVARVDSALTGRNLFVRTPLWYDARTRRDVSGLRHIEVHIDSVGPGDDYFPAAVYFHATDPQYLSRTDPDGHGRMLLLSTGTSRAATRTFDTLFSFSDTRKTHPEIKDDVWALIIASKVRNGMSREECRLALGSPHEVLRTPSYSGMRESWSYSDGVYLIFDDGFLTRFRL